MPDPVKDYLASIGRKGGSVKGTNLGNKHAQKYSTEAERQLARKQQQQAYRNKQKEKAK